MAVHVRTDERAKRIPTVMEIPAISNSSDPGVATAVHQCLAQVCSGFGGGCSQGVPDLREGREKAKIHLASSGGLNGEVRCLYYRLLAHLFTNLV